MQDKKWRSVFTTEFLETACDATHFAALSNVSNELPVIYYFRGRVADMSKELPTVFGITQTKIYIRTLQSWKGKTDFLLLKSENKLTKNNACIYQYLYRSNHLQPCSGAEILLNNL